MTEQRALVLGGTGMLAGCAESLVSDGWQVVLPSRRRPSMTPADQTGPGGWAWVKADWSDPEALARDVAPVLGGPADLLVAWVHREVRVPVLRAVAPLLAPGAPVVEVLDGVAGGPERGGPDPVLDDHPTQQVLLGLVRHAGRTRWLYHEEIAGGVLDAVRRALAGKPPAAHQIGEHRPVLR